MNATTSTQGQPPEPAIAPPCKEPLPEPTTPQPEHGRYSLIAVPNCKGRQGAYQELLSKTRTIPTHKRMLIFRCNRTAASVCRKSCRCRLLSRFRRLGAGVGMALRLG